LRRKKQVTMETETTFKALSATIRNCLYEKYPEKVYFLKGNPRVKIVVVEEERQQKKR